MVLHNKQKLVKDLVLFCGLDQTGFHRGFPGFLCSGLLVWSISEGASHFVGWSCYNMECLRWVFKGDVSCCNILRLYGNQSWGRGSRLGHWLPQLSWWLFNRSLTDSWISGTNISDGLIFKFKGMIFGALGNLSNRFSLGAIFDYHWP